MSDESEGPSLLDLAKQGLEGIVKLSESQLISEKLQSLNMLLFVFIVTGISTYLLVAPDANELTFVAFLVVSFIFGLIASLGYGPLLAIVTNFSSNKIEGLRVGIMILVVSLTLSIAALTFRIGILNTLSGFLILVQLLVVPISGVLFPKVTVSDTEIKPSQIWDALGKISTVVSIIGFVIDLILILINAI